MTYALTSKDIYQFLMKEELLMQATGGIFSIDTLPKNVKDTIYFINSHPSNLPGEHWLVVYFPENLKKNTPEFFDSLGKGPNHYSTNITHFMGNQYVYNTQRLQAHNSSTCGLYCLYFLYYRVRGYSFSNILNRFSLNLKHNDSIVIDFFIKKTK